ncbi:PREDICTED: uncharacterized protein LOC109483513 [Branchiostoma belcheri]|uniref:Uncharacterized protein LOC109483513 n=1 Tax=Branchiostoma belcheri TaxID=7741 RepID=A0A6P4ZYS8_BRABE|nr:PREDICTED: uncharacterized protein LOC109483513 [Branchiostoma belcheri]
MNAESDGHLKLLQVIPADKLDVYEGVPTSFKHGSLVIDEPPVRILTMDDQEETIVGNLTCMRTVRPKESQERITCFRHIVEALLHLSPENLTRVADTYIAINTTSDDDIENRDAIADALGAMATNDSLTLLTRLVLTPRQKDAKLVMRALFHFFGLECPPPQITIETVENMCFKWRMEFDDEEEGLHVWTRAHLLLGTLAGNIYATDPARADKIIDRFHGMVEIHDPWKHRQLRSTLTEDEYNSHLHEKATILGALGNAGMDRSYDLLLSYMNTTEAPSELKRTSMTALKSYDHEKAADEILRVAIEDPDGNVRYAAALDYLSHPRASRLWEAQQQINNSYTNQTAIAEAREKRGLPAVRKVLEKLFKGFDFKLETPSVDWQKKIGSSQIGASLGIIIRNMMELNLKPLKGKFEVDVLDQAYAKIHVGLLGIDWTFLDARICFKGKAGYEVNIFQEFNFDEVFKLVKLFDGVINKVIGNVKNNIIRFKKLLGSTTGSIDGIFKDIVDAADNLPNQVREFKVKAKEFTKKVGEYTNLPPTVENVKQVVHRVSTLLGDVKADVMEFYNSISDAVTITLPWAAEQIESGVKMVVSSVGKLIKTPKTAISDIFKGLTTIKNAVVGVIKAKERIEKALLFKEDKTLHWMNLKDELSQISEDISAALKSLRDMNNWVVQQTESKAFNKRFFGVDIKALKEQIKTEFKDLLDGLLGPLNKVRKVPNMFLNAYKETAEIVKSIKEGYTAIKNGYDEAKSLIEQIFGAKADQAFPRKYLESAACGDGFYPSTGSGRYEHQGVLLEAASGQEISAPFSGIIKRSGDNQVTITTDSMEKLEVIINNVELNPEKELKRVFKGTLIGTVSSSACQPNHIHLAIRNTESGGLVDPTRFMEKRDMVVPSWDQECGDWNLVFKNEVVSRGKFGKAKEEDKSPARVEPDISDLDKEFLDVNKRKKRDVGQWFGQAKDFVGSLELPDLKETVSLLDFEFDFRNLKLSKVFEFMTSSGLTDTKARLEQTVEGLLDSLHQEKTSCQVPDTLDDSALRRILRDGGNPATGSRATLLKNYRTPENRCPNLREYLPKNMHCFFEDNCLGVTCCVELNLAFTRQTVSAFAMIYPCSKQLTLGLGSWKKTFDISGPRFGVADLEKKFSLGEIEKLIDEVSLTTDDVTKVIKELRKLYRDMVKVTPTIGAQVWGGLGISLGLFEGRLQIRGYIMTTSFPCTAELRFNKFPLDVGIRMDMNLVPLRLELRGILELTIPLIVKTIRKTLINKLIWQYSMPTIHATIFAINSDEPDKSPPNFQVYANPFDSPVEERAARTTNCIVRQQYGRDYTEPAFLLELAVDDDRSEVDLTYSVGVTRGGSDQVLNQPLGGFTTIVPQLTSLVTCELPTYDLTLPGGRVTPDFLSTSHPGILRASAVALDDAALVNQKEAVGFGRKVYGDQVVPWKDISISKIEVDISIGHDPHDTRNLEYFAAPRLGRVLSKPHHVANYPYAQNCARDCLALPATKCLSFNYDYSDDGRCELLEEIEGHGVVMYTDGVFHNFERLGIGHAVKVVHEDVSLAHDNLYYYNLFLNNTVGYTNTLTSMAVIADFVPPSPGPLANVSHDVTAAEVCEEFLPDEWEDRCVEQTPLPNHRAIIDGEGSRTVFNGNKPLEDLRYFRPNTYVTANWDGFHDNETGIFGYTWTVGTDHCQEDVHPHKDPHSHLYGENEWTHQGLAYPLELKDGFYHVSVRAVNKVEFGGPLATTVCHGVPYTIDTTPPFVNEVELISYDENTYELIVEYNVSDPLSNIREVDIGLGKSPRDVFIKDWHRHDNRTHVTMYFRIPDGIPTWIKVRAINNVDLRASGHYSRPLIVDTTPPIPGTVHDGETYNRDRDYQADGTRVCTSWKDFHDEESGIGFYWWGVGTEIGTVDTLPFRELPHTQHAACAELNQTLQHGVTYYTTLVAFNLGHAMKNVSVYSDGGNSSADTSPHVIHEATSVGKDAHSINWHHFHLHDGDFVYVVVNVSNGAGGVVVTESDGFTMDTTPPVMRFIGDGNQQRTDLQYSASITHLSANWEFEDPESAIDHYKLAVFQHYGGTRLQIYPAQKNKWVTVDGSADGWTNSDPLSLVPGARYSVRVSAVNGAGLTTTHDTDGVIVDPTPPSNLHVAVDVMPGELEELHDGYVLHTDLSAILVSWRATDGESKVMAYWAAVGTSPGATDVLPFENMGADRSAYIDNLQLQLYDESTGSPVYYVTVKAQNGAGAFSSEVVSSPIKVVPGDKTGVVLDGPHMTDSESDDVATVDVDYQLHTGTVTVRFKGFESARHGIVHYEWAVGTAPLLDDVQSFSSAGIVLYDGDANKEGIGSEGHAQALLPLQPGQLYYTTVRAITGAGNVLESASDGFTVDVTPPQVGLRTVAVSPSLTVDSTPPVAGDVICPRHIPGTDEFRCSWHGFRDDQSYIDHFLFGVGTEEGDDSVFPFTRVAGTVDRFKAKGFAGQFLRHQESYYATVIAYNAVGGKTSAYSEAIVIDATPPVPGTVVELDSIYHADLQGDNSDGKAMCENEEDCEEMDAMCQASLTQVAVAWQPFVDPETPITRYDVAVGTVPGAADLSSFHQVPDPDVRFFVVKNLDLSDIRQVFVTVRGHNAAGLSSVAVSNGVYISKISAGFPPLKPFVVNDGRSNRRGDIDFQSHNEEMSAHWDLSGDPCPSVRTEWSVVRLDGVEILPLTELSPGADRATSDEFDLRDGETYYTVVRATNQLGYSYSVRSDGVTVRLEPLVPGVVRDGAILGFDLSHQQSVTTLSANWDSFGKEYGLGDDAVINGEAVEIGDHQIIDHYEVAVGTDRRYPSTRTNIRPFTNVGQNKTVTFEYLQLVPRTGIYYVTVRAVSLASSTTEVTSNGIRVGFGGDIISHGEVQVPRYISSNANITVAWSDFEFTMSILLYQWGITSNRTELESMDCLDLQNFDQEGYAGVSEDHAHLFDVYPLTKVGRNTMVQYEGLELQHGHTYHVVVVATDEAAQCAMALADVTIDTSPPVEGRVFVGAPGDKNVMYTAMADRMEVLWDGSHDNTSGIARFEVALLSGGDCQSPDDARRNVEVAFVPVAANASSYTFVDIDLKADTPYYVTFRAINRADLVTESTTPPILLDRLDPVAGDVKDGLDFETDATHQSSLSEMKGVIIHHPNPVGDPCPKRNFPMDEMHDSWSALETTGLWGVSGERRIVFDPERLSFEEDEGLSVQMTRDIEYERMMSGAYSTQADGSRTGQYEMDIVAASGELQAVTSVVFWGGLDGVVGDHNEMSLEQEDALFPSSNENCSCCQPGNITTGAAGNVTGDCNCTCVSPTSEPQYSTEEPTSTTDPPPGWSIEKGDTEGETPETEPNSHGSPYASCGLQIHSETANNPSYVGLWCRFANGTQSEQGETVKLDFDPSAAWHKYTLQFMEEKIFATKVDRSVRLYIDGQFKAVLTGIPTLSPTSKLILTTWNKHDWIPELVDPFEPPTTTASFRSVSLPPEASSLCLQGKPFRNGDHAVVRFEAGVGSAKLLDDVAPFREVSKPCIPCSVRCDVLGCDPDCDEDKTYVHQIHLTGLNLPPLLSVPDSNTTVQAVYYLTVRAVAGSGRAAIASSNGIYIDVTPPVIENLFHVDLSWSPDEPTRYQGDNSTIAVYWEAYDKESEVVECQWAVGTSPGQTDVQNFTSVGPEQNLVYNNKLEGKLSNRQTYYVTVRLVNGAGLVSEKTTTGVTVLLDPPNTSSSNITTSCEHTVETNSTLGGVDLCGDQEKIDIAWTRVEDDSVNNYVFSVGTSEDSPGDVIPQTQVGYNESGWVQVIRGELAFGRSKVNISDLRSREDGPSVKTHHKFHVEPGRTLFTRLTACHAGHKCADIAVKKRTILRAQDKVLTFKNGSTEDIELADGNESENSTIIIAKYQGEDTGVLKPGAVGAGILTDNDVSMTYTSNRPFISNPAFTIHQTDRFLKNRVRKEYGQSFFVSSIGGDEVDAPLTVTATYNESALLRNEIPRMVFWDPESEIWRDVQGTCTDITGAVDYNWQKGLFTVKLCSTAAAQGHRSRRSVQRYFSGTSQLAVVIINGTFQNEPPILLSPLRMSMGEDEGTLITRLIAKDPEDDDLVFMLNDQPQEFGDLVELDKQGTLRYKPALDFSGTREIPITISESRTDSNPLLSTTVTINIDVMEENDNPQPFVVHEGEEKLQGSGIIHLTVEENHPDNVDFEVLKFVAGSFDVDANDAMTLHIKAPSNGTIVVGKHVKKITFKEPKCTMPVEGKRREWADVFNKSWAGPAIPYPCGIVLPHSADTMNWAVAAITYTPNQHFFGEDAVKIYAEDASGARSKLVTVVIHVMENRCLNGGKCVGPQSDPDCKDQSRSDGFDGYMCNCTVGFEGRYCEINPNDCIPDPCPKNYTCIDQVNSYVCHCEPGWPCDSLTVWEIVGITVGCLVALIILIVIFRVWKKKKDEALKVSQSLTGSQDSLNRLTKPSGSAVPSNAILNPAYETMNVTDGQKNFDNVKKVWEEDVEEVEFHPVELEDEEPVSKKLEPQLVLPPAATGKTAPDASEDQEFISLPGTPE